jgi:hypothetical protein
VAENDWLPFAQILVIDLSSVFGRDLVHGFDSLVSATVLPVFNTRRDFGNKRPTIGEDLCFRISANYQKPHTGKLNNGRKANSYQSRSDSA